jgi:branched-chain amino acid transport system substrate-binding protein
VKHTARKFIALMASAALVVAASTGCTSPAETSEPVDSETTLVKIGFAAPLTGDNAIYGEGMKRAVELAIEEANASEEAKAAGYKFEIRAEDDAADPKQAVNVANALVGDSAVAALVGHFNSGCSIPAAPVYNKADLAMVTVSSNPQLTAQGYGIVNRIVAKDDAQGGFAGELAASLGLKNVAIIDDATPYGQGLASEFKKAFTAAGGTVVSEDRVQAKEVNFASVVTKLKSAGPDAVYYAGAHTEGALLTKQMTEGGLTVPVMGGDMLYSAEYINIAGAENAEGDRATLLGLPLDQQPKGAEFLSKYEAKYGKAPEAYDSYAYDAAVTIINAVLSAGPERAAVAAAIRAGSVEGVTGTVAFDENGDNKVQVISSHQVVNGEWKQVEN